MNKTKLRCEQWKNDKETKKFKQMMIRSKEVEEERKKCVKKMR